MNLRKLALAVATVAVCLVAGVALADPAYVAVFASLSRVPGTYNSPTYYVNRAVGSRFHLSISAVSPKTLVNAKVQEYDQLSQKYLDVSGMAFAVQTTTGDVYLEVYPGIPSVANKQIPDFLPSAYRVIATVTSASSTFSLSNTYVPPLQ